MTRAIEEEPSMQKPPPEGPASLPTRGLRTIPVADILIRDNVRTEFTEDEIARMGKSLKDHGQLAPIRVAPAADAPGKYDLLMGERRVRGARHAGLETLEAIVEEDRPSPSRILALQLVENVLREDLSPLDLAHGFRQVMEGNGWNGSRLAEELHVHPSTVTRALALLDLPEDLQVRVNAGELSPGVAREVSRLASEQAMRALADQAKEQGMTAEEVRQVVSAQRRIDRSGKKPRSGDRDRNLIRFDGWIARVEPQAITLRFADRRAGGRARTLEQKLAAVEALAARLREELGAAFVPASVPTRPSQARERGTP
jgi:ParB/RepB/Spo0J family partition protein